MRLDFSWTAGRTEGRVTEVTVTLDPHPAGVLLVLEHRGLPGPTAREEHRHGWTAILEMLGAHLGSG